MIDINHLCYRCLIPTSKVTSTMQITDEADIAAAFNGVLDEDTSCSSSEKVDYVTVGS